MIQVIFLNSKDIGLSPHLVGNFEKETQRVGF